MSKTDTTTSAPTCKPKKIENEGLYGVDEIIDIFSIGKQTFSNWKKKGLRPLYEGKSHLYDGGEIRAFLKELRDG